MVIRNLRSGRRLAALAIFAVIAVSAFGFAASNTVGASQAGDGSGAISGYTVTNVKYNLDGTTPSNLASVEFDLSAAATSVRAKVVSTATSYATCSNPSGNHWSCPVTNTVASADELRVIAVQ